LTFPRPSKAFLRTLGLWLAASIASWVVLVWTFAFEFERLGPLPEVSVSPSLDVDAATESSADAGDRDDVEPSDLSIPDRLGPGDSLSSVLGRNGFGSSEVYEIARALSAVMDVRALRDGDDVEIRYREGDVGSISIHHGDLERVELVRSEAGWQSEWTRVDVEHRTVEVAGILADNLFASMARLGETASLTVAFASVFSWDIDFHSQSREGDRFGVVVDKLYREGEFVGYGEVRAARYVSTLGGERVFDAFLYEDPEGRRDYYDAEGKSLRKAFLRAPVKFERISSGFSYSRMHPIEHRRMPHLGVDYAARKGTPVYSVAAGVVVDRGWRGGGGNTIAIQHAMGYSTKYLHLSRFASDLRVGKRVDQREIIGYVGDTGTATAPHLDFRVYRYGKPVNPLTQIFPPGPPVPDALRPDFEAKKALLESELESLTSPRPVLATDS
jgi:murein DD-endopeptidase MepM/ murein hydrolase activator NlpD